MFKAFSGALSLALTIMVLRLALPEVGVALVEVIIKALHIVSTMMDIAARQPM